MAPHQNFKSYYEHVLWFLQQEYIIYYDINGCWRTRLTIIRNDQLANQLAVWWWTSMYSLVVGCGRVGLCLQGALLFFIRIRGVEMGCYGIHSSNLYDFLIFSLSRCAQRARSIFGLAKCRCQSFFLRHRPRAACCVCTKQSFTV